MSERRYLPIDGIAYEIRVKPTDGWSIPSGVAWDGYRVQARAAGGRRWMRFTLVDHDHEPTDDELTAAVRALFTPRAGTAPPAEPDVAS